MRTRVARVVTAMLVSTSVASSGAFVHARSSDHAAGAEPSAAPVSDTRASTAMKVAVLPLSVDGPLSESDQSLLMRALVDGLRRGQFDVVAPDDVVAAHPKVGEECGPRCLRKTAVALGVDYLVRAQVSVQDRDYGVVVQLFARDQAEPVARSEDGCEICGISDASRLMSTAAATLRTKLDALASGPPEIEIVSSPSDADVTIDGEFAGRTPLQRSLAAGKRVVRISKEGFITLERELTIVEGVQEHHAFELEKVPSRLPSRPWGWVSVALGAASVGTSIVFAVLDDRPYRVGRSCDASNIDASGQCRRLWDTQYIALGTALGGAALITLGAAILASGAKRRGAQRLGPNRAALDVGPGSIGIRF